MKPDYNDLAEAAKNGLVVAPRGVMTYEVPQVTPVVLRPGETLWRPNMNYELAWLEALMVIGGVFDLDLIAKVAPRSRLDLYAKQSDYGPRMADGLSRVVDLLGTDPSSRRAVVHIDRPDDACTDNETCATSVQFLLRGNKLNTIVTMRSWDMYLGMPYDIITFGALAQVVATVVGYNIGTLTCVPGSLHLYDSNVDQVNGVGPGWLFWMRGFSLFAGQPWALAAAHARKFLKMAPWPNGTPACIGVVR